MWFRKHNPDKAREHGQTYGQGDSNLCPPPPKSVMGKMCVSGVGGGVLEWVLIPCWSHVVEKAGENQHYAAFK